MEPWPTPLDYDPSLEWPGSHVVSDFEAYDRNERPTPQHQTCCRLVVKSSAVLARKRRIAVLDAYEEIQIGRDAPPSEDMPRIRLKEMEVSKLHATLFWDRERKERAIVDMGSKHGTFVKSASSSASHASIDGMNNGIHDSSDTEHSVVAPEPAFARLSPSKVASVPRILRHSDELSIGSTSFLVHIHPSGLPCDECRSEGEFDIPLFSKPNGKSRQTQSAGVSEEKSRAPHDAKMAMTLLKRSLLSRHSDTSSSAADVGGASSSQQHYIDRSAKRRALYPYSRSSSLPPGVVLRPPSRSASSSTANVPGRLVPAISSGVSFAYESSRSSSTTPPSTPPPISDANVGHRLLEKQGWVPGTTLGVPAPRSSSFNTSDTSDKEEGRHAMDERTALSEPLQLAANIGRRGLGMRSDLSRPTSGEIPAKGQRTATLVDWKIDSRKRRWDEANRSIV